MAGPETGLPLSVVVIFHNMRREAKRTLHSLGPAHQRGVSAQDYEIIAIDNGSDTPLDPAELQAVAPNIRYHFHDTASASPAGAVNLGAQMARGKYLALIVDGARMVTPGVIADTLGALTKFPEPFVCTLGWHLGPDVQNVSMLTGYDQAEEDRMLAALDWRSDGYRLFEAATLARSSRVGLLGGMPAECSWFAMRRDSFTDMGGYDDRFTAPGGGLVNHAFMNRLAARKGLTPVVLLGQGSFHQFHGGVATNVDMQDHPMQRFRQEYEALFGTPFRPRPLPTPFYFGTIPPAALQFVTQP